MAVSAYRRGWVVCLAALAGFGCWYLVAGTGVERAAFGEVMRGFAKPPFFLTGKGGRDDPWELRTLSVKARIDTRKAPVVVSIGDDADGVFQSSPPSPVDLAVVLENLQRLGARQAAIAAVMAWEKPDPVALKGLEMVLNHFEMVIHAAPLSRGTVRQAMPPAFRRAALVPEAIQGDLSKLPMVNHVAVPDVIFGGERALAGFTAVNDADEGKGTLALLARWEDEKEKGVVLAFPLLAVLARYDLPVAGIQVKLGEFLRLGPAGPVVPIDEGGCLALPLKPLAARADVSAEALISGTPEIFPADPGLIVLRDDQSKAPGATRKFSANLASAIAAISSDAGLGQASSYRRLAAPWEAALLLGVAVLLGLLVGTPQFRRYLACGILVAVCVAAQWLVVGLAQVWLPGIPLLAAIGAGGLGMVLLDRALPAAHPVPVPVAVPVAWALSTTAAMGRFRSVTIWKEPLGRRDVPQRVPSVNEAPVVVTAPAPVPGEVAPLAAEAAPMEEVVPEVEEVEEEVPEEARFVPMPEEIAKAQRKAAGRKGSAKRRQGQGTAHRRADRNSAGKPPGGSSGNR